MPHSNRLQPYRLARWLALVAASGCLFVLLHPGIGGARGSTLPATPCAAAEVASPVPVAPAAGMPGAGTPVAAGGCMLPLPAAGGTPAAAGGLQVGLALGSTEAGLVDLTVTLSDDAGRPVDGATVTVTGQHLTMDMGRFPHQALPAGPGRYVAPQVGLGMGGPWRIDVEIALPGQAPVTVAFLAQLSGL